LAPFLSFLFMRQVRGAYTPPHDTAAAALEE